MPSCRRYGAGGYLEASSFLPRCWGVPLIARSFVEPGQSAVKPRFALPRTHDLARFAFVQIAAQPVVPVDEPTRTGGEAGSELFPVLAGRDAIGAAEIAREMEGARVAEVVGDFRHVELAAFDFARGLLDAQELGALHGAGLEVVLEQTAQVLRRDVHALRQLREPEPSARLPCDHRHDLIERTFDLVRKAGRGGRDLVGRAGEKHA